MINETYKTAYIKLTYNYYHEHKADKYGDERERRMLHEIAAVHETRRPVTRQVVVVVVVHVTVCRCR